MNLREWTSNDPEFVSLLPEEDRAKEANTKVLSLYWDMNEDTLNVPHVSFTKASGCSKRTILKAMLQIFDPLGYFTPITV